MANSTHSAVRSVMCIVQNSHEATGKETNKIIVPSPIAVPPKMLVMVAMDCLTTTVTFVQVNSGNHKLTIRPNKLVNTAVSTGTKNAKAIFNRC